MTMVASVMRWLGRSIVRLPQVLVLGLLWFYQKVVSPWTPPTCKYYPSCSTYAVTAISRHGLLRGGWLSAHRLVRCNPWSLGGVDDVPPARHHAGVLAS